MAVIGRPVTPVAAVPRSGSTAVRTLLSTAEEIEPEFASGAA
jgi:hypothetical protein